MMQTLHNYDGALLGHKKAIIYIKVMRTAIWISLLIPFRSLPRIIKLIHYSHSKTSAAPEYLVKVIDRISRWQAFVIRNNCLKKSLLLYYIFYHSGDKDIELCIGINKKGAHLDGHSWLLKGGHPVLDEAEFIDIYTVIHSFTPESNLYGY